MPELLFELGDPLGWNTKTYKDNKIMQVNFIAELNITTYNNFRDVLFWDVIQALSKLYMVQLNVKQKKRHIEMLTDIMGGSDNEQEQPPNN